MKLNRSEIIVRLLVLSANVFILYYVTDLEKKNCDCSDSWIRDYIKIVSSLMIALNIMSLFVVNLHKELRKLAKTNNLVKLILILLNIVLLGYVILIVTYYNKLNKDDSCDCSENWKRYALLYPLAIIAPFVLFVMYTIVMYGSVNISVKGNL